jgi:hypothetical protein
MLQWTLAIPYGIQRDAAGQIWHAGRLLDVLELDPNTILVAAERGGVWRVSAQGDAAALSDRWGNPDVLALAHGPDGAHHVFACCGEFHGKGAVWVTDPNAAEPLSAWHKIAAPDAARGVTRLVVLPAARRVVISAQRGVWWSPIPPAANPFAYQWTQAAGLAVANDVYSEVAQGPQESVVAAIPGNGLFHGDWATGPLQMQRAVVPAGIMLGRTSITSCAADRRIMYAVSGDDVITALLSSRDGGRTWRNLVTQVIGARPQTTVAAQAGGQGSHNNCIAVSPVNSAIVALGWRGGPFVSEDSGRNWQKFSDSEPALHGDLNALSFRSNGTRLYIGSDGGVAAADVVVRPPTQPFLQNFVSVFNHRLANLQFECWPPRVVWGTFSVSYSFAAGGLQDNGNVYARWRDRSPWRQSGQSDGQLALLLSDKHLLFDNTGDHTSPTLATWDGATMAEKGVPPLRNADGTFNPGGVTGLGSPKELFVEAVRAPALPSRANANFKIAAVGGVSNSVFGLFDDDRPNTNHHWEPLGTVPLAANDFITAIGSYDGLAIFVGTNAGRMFRLNPVSATQVDMTPANLGMVTCIVTDASAPAALRGFACAGNRIVQLTGAATNSNAGAWTVLGPVAAPDDVVFDLAVDWSANPLRLYAATDMRVFSSADGRRWDNDSQGLPEVPHGSALEIAGGRVFLGTFGRSMWSASLMVSWSGEEDLGGVLSTAPAACTWGPGRVDAFYRGQNQHLWHRWFEGTWHNEEDLGGVLTTAPGACTWGPGRVDIFYSGQNQHLWHRWFDGTWHNEEDLGGVLTSAPAACTWGPGRIDIFYRGQNQHLWHRWFDGTWHNEEDLGGVLTSAPAACTWGPGRVDIFYRGQNQHLWHRWFDGNWHNEEDLGDVLTSAPAACTWGPGRVDVFYRGQNDHLWHRWFEGNWHNEEDLGGSLSEAPAACSWGPKRIDTFYRGQNQRLWHRWYPV